MFVSQITWYLICFVRRAGLRHTKYMREIAAAAAPSGTGAAPPAHPWRHARPREISERLSAVEAAVRQGEAPWRGGARATE